MKLNYHPETDSLYIDLSEQPSTESREISERSEGTRLNSSHIQKSRMPSSA